MLVAVICRMNQARSPFVQGVLLKNFGDHQIISSGFEAIPGNNLIGGVEELAKSWDIPLPKKKSTQLQDDKAELLKADLIICAEARFEGAVRELGYSGKITSFESLIFDPSFMPLDPEGLTVDKFKREIAKASAVAIRAVRNELSLTFPNPILVVTPNGTTDCDLALTHAVMEAKLRDAILVDADLRAPNTAGIRELNLTSIEFDLNDLDNLQLPTDNASQILTHKYQVNHPGQFLLSPIWSNFLMKLTQHRPVVLLTAPRYTPSTRLPESFLISAYASAISLISS